MQLAFSVPNPIMRRITETLTTNVDRRALERLEQHVRTDQILFRHNLRLETLDATPELLARVGTTGMTFDVSVETRNSNAKRVLDEIMERTRATTDVTSNDRAHRRSAARAFPMRAVDRLPAIVLLRLQMLTPLEESVLGRSARQTHVLITRRQ